MFEYKCGEKRADLDGGGHMATELPGKVQDAFMCGGRSHDWMN